MFEGVLTGLVGIMAIGALMGSIHLEGSIRKHKYCDEKTPLDLPTVSVCIPARNEVHAMTACLERVLASDYPKLEIIVLDDNSVDDTSILIKSFAHAGVRFVEGRPLPHGWLGKNNALQRLLEEASGEYVLFLDVDTTLRPGSISKVVAWALSRQLDLVSVLPQREDGLRASVFLGTLRYFWILFFSRARYSAMSGACWLVHRDKLIGLGGFNSYKSLTQPEEAVANALDGEAMSRLIISNSKLGISYEKKWSSQVETSIRLLRPLLGSTGRSVLMAAMLVALVVFPLSGLVVGLMMKGVVLLVLSMLSILFITTLSLQYYKIVWRYGWWLGAIHWPYVVLQEAVLIIASIYKYRRGTVTWKGRPIKTILS